MQKTNATVSSIKLLFFGLSFFYFCNLASAQLKIGPKIGLAYSSLHELNPNNNFNTSFPKTLNRKTLTLGISSQLKLTEKWFLQGDFFYTERGTNGSDLGNGIDYIQRLNFKYIDTNVSLSYHPFKYIFIEIGSYYSYLLSMTRSGFADWGGNYTVDDTDIFFRYDYGLSAGASLQHWNIILSLRYFYGLKITSKPENSFNTKIRLLQVTLGYYFVL